MKIADLFIQQNAAEQFIGIKLCFSDYYTFLYCDCEWTISDKTYTNFFYLSPKERTGWE